MLRKIEQRLNFLAEAREFIAGGPKLKDLQKKEYEIHGKRKNERIQRQQDEQKMILEEKQRRNEAKIKKQEELKIF